MNQAAIKVANVTMRFRLTHEKVETLKDLMIRFMKRKLIYSEFTALQSVSFQVYKGERLGIIGHNGAGKSTLLKLISGVMKPTEGHISVEGSIAPLLELGAGFDPELTGSDNIYLNGAILGKSKDFLDEKYDDIVKYAGLGKFIDTPLKNYSSGMRAKLGFSIATQIEPDILIVDEILGVGDEAFKKKSKRKMRRMINSGKTLVLVSHSLKEIEALTDRVVWLHEGRMEDIGEPKAVCKKYRKMMGRL